MHLGCTVEAQAQQCQEQDYNNSLEMQKGKSEDGCTLTPISSAEANFSSVAVKRLDLTNTV